MSKKHHHVCWMIRRDMPQVCDIEDLSFDYPWSKNQFIHALRQRNCIGMVVDQGDDVIAFVIYELHKNRLHLLNLAVHPDHRRKGVGKAILAKLQNKLSYERRNRIMTEVRETNVGAQLFFKEAGFRCISVLHDFWDDDSVEDAYLFQYRYQPTESDLRYAAERRVSF